MGTYGYISIIAMLCYGFMLLMFLTAKRNKIINSFLVVLTGLLFWTGGSAFMRAQLWPGCEFWYQVFPVWEILLVCHMRTTVLYSPLAVKRAVLRVRIYFVVMLTCFWLNAQFGVFLEAPKMVEKNGAAAFVYEIKPAIIVFFIPSAIFLIHLFTVIVRICKNNPTMKVQYEPVMLGILALFLGNAFLGIPFFSGFPIDILSGVVNVFLLFYALIRRRLFRLQMLASPSLCYGVGFLFSILVFLNIVPSLQNLFHMRADKNTRIYTLVFSIVFLIIYALFTYLWKLLIRCVFVREENHQAEKIREFNSAISKTLDLQEILDKTIHVMKDLMDVGNIYICMQDAPGEPYRGVASDQPLSDSSPTSAVSLESVNPIASFASSLNG